MTQNAFKAATKTALFHRVLLTSELVAHDVVVENLQVVRVAIEGALDVEALEAEGEPFALRRFDEDEAVEVPHAPLRWSEQQTTGLHALHAQVQRRGTPLIHEICVGGEKEKSKHTERFKRTPI